jgi:hypothetical protein
MRRPCNKKRGDKPTDEPPPWEGHQEAPRGVAAMAEAQIGQAQREGVLDNLPGMGKPMEKDPGVGACQIFCLSDIASFLARAMAYCYCPPRH